MKRALALLLAVGAVGCSRSQLDTASPNDGDGAAVADSRPRERPDSGIQPIDGSLADADKSGCDDASVSSGLVVSMEGDLARYVPSSGFTTLGAIGCSLQYHSPGSMAVARDGGAFVFYELSTLVAGHAPPTEIARVDPISLACDFTSYTGPSDERIGMGFTANGLGPTETLYTIDTDGGLSTLDTAKFEKSLVGNVDFLGEIAGGGDGRLFTFFSPDDAPGSAIAELDKTTGKVIALDHLFDLPTGSAWAFFRVGAFFFLFTDDGKGGSTVSSYDLTKKVLDLHVDSYPGRIVGAGASSCASP